MLFMDHEKCTGVYRLLKRDILALEIRDTLESKALAPDGVITRAYLAFIPNRGQLFLRTYT